MVSEESISVNLGTIEQVKRVIINFINLLDEIGKKVMLSVEEKDEIYKLLNDLGLTYTEIARAVGHPIEFVDPEIRDQFIKALLKRLKREKLDYTVD